MFDLTDVGETVRRLRHEKRLTREELATLSQVSRARIEALENNRAAEIGFNAVWRLLRVLGHDIAIVPANQGRPDTYMIQSMNEQEETRNRDMENLKRRRVRHA